VKASKQNKTLSEAII